MLIQRFWKKRALVIVAAVFLLTLLALDLNAIVFQGKADVSQAQAALQFHFRHATIINGQVQCPEGGFDCIVIVLAGKEITIPLIPLE